jgi:hypothetical protein
MVVGNKAQADSQPPEEPPFPFLPFLFSITHVAETVSYMEKSCRKSCGRPQNPRTWSAGSGGREKWAVRKQDGPDALIAQGCIGGCEGIGDFFLFSFFGFRERERMGLLVNKAFILLGKSH